MFNKKKLKEKFRESFKEPIIFLPSEETIEKCMLSLISYYNKQKEMIERLQKKIDKYNKDDEIQKLNSELKSVRERSLLILSEKENKDFNNFRKIHREKGCKNISGQITLNLSFTGIGTAIEVTCPDCGETKDITDFDCW